MSAFATTTHLIWSACRDGLLSAEIGAPERAAEVADALRRAGTYPDLPEEIACVARAGARRIALKLQSGAPSPLVA